MKIELYSDGGCRNNQSNNNIGAWGAYMVYGKHSKEISGYDFNTTNNKMELTGCIEGLKAIKNKSIPVEVFLDSNYVLEGVTKWINGWKKKNWKKSDKKDVLNKELWIELDKERGKFKDIKFIKVKGHSGNKGNEKADELCNNAMDNAVVEK